MWFNIGEEEEPPNYLQKMAEIMKMMMLQKTCNKEDDAELESQHNTRVSLVNIYTSEIS